MRSCTPPRRCALGEASGRPVERLNVGALGLVTPQLHVHVLGRRRDDGLGRGRCGDAWARFSLTTTRTWSARSRLCRNDWRVVHDHGLGLRPRRSSRPTSGRRAGRSGSGPSAVVAAAGVEADLQSARAAVDAVDHADARQRCCAQVAPGAIDRRSAAGVVDDHGEQRAAGRPSPSTRRPASWPARSRFPPHAAGGSAAARPQALRSRPGISPPALPWSEQRRAGTRRRWAPRAGRSTASRRAERPGAQPGPRSGAWPKPAW